MKRAIADRISEEDYLAGEKLSGIKREYVAGEIFAMAGAAGWQRDILGPGDTLVLPGFKLHPDLGVDRIHEDSGIA